jgi:hypothetical protein
MPSGRRPKPPFDDTRSTTFQRSASITVRSPLALFATKAKVRLLMAGAGSGLSLPVGWQAYIGRPETCNSPFGPVG